ncbi:MAG: hypothetical protein HY897_04785 [Deltaproteobacteria bacterium]|nr:hypothetical protein [Deltaproteobacteria bacterium]
MGCLLAVIGGAWLARPAAAYPPAVGILGQSRSCLACHGDSGPWTDEARTIVDILDAKTKRSLRGRDGVPVIEVPRGGARTVLTVIGRRNGDAKPPQRHAWIYVDPAQIGSSGLSKFAPGWEVNLPMACRLAGDKLEGYEGSHLTVLPMTIKPAQPARDAEVELQVMLVAGEPVKGKGREGLVSNYVVRKVLLKVTEPKQ